MKSELQSLKDDISRVIGDRSGAIASASKIKIEDLSQQLKAAIEELGQTLVDEQSHVGHVVAERPITTLASAFALGVVVGFMLRRA
ncbi:MULTISPECIES: hypothetical protein [unclassified Bradyrhizobium]|uniref:hypothetical protein n=1 Tax=unclassified Bradyrhizobium TaxID=2631580 RepID=UPI00201380E0|nr:MULTISPECIES: hypothetical protein [unclassified Bradyrhizobium]